MKTLLTWLRQNNYNFKTVTMTDGRKGIMVDTNYNGEHPKPETWAAYTAISNKCKRLGLQVEPRGYYTAMLITIAK
jgi:hypothetical protein